MLESKNARQVIHSFWWFYAAVQGWGSDKQEQSSGVEAKKTRKEVDFSLQDKRDL